MCGSHSISQEENSTNNEIWICAFNVAIWGKNQLLMNKNICVLIFDTFLACSSIYIKLRVYVLKVLRQISKCNDFIEHIELSLKTYIYL